MSQNNGVLNVAIPADCTDPVIFIERAIATFMNTTPINGLNATIDIETRFEEVPVEGPRRYFGTVTLKDGELVKNNVHPLLSVPEYMAKIRGWATDRNIIGGGSTDLDQFIKGLTEAGEFWTHIGKRQTPMLKDDIGDIIVCLVNAVGCLDVNLEDYTTVIPEDQRTAAASLYKAKGLKRYSLQVLYGLTAVARYIEKLEDSSNPDEQDNGFPHGDEEFYKTDVAEAAADVVYALETVAIEHGWSLAECLHEAYHDIRDRKGLMVSGTFVKESDFTREMVQAALADESTKPSTRDYLTAWLNK